MRRANSSLFLRRTSALSTLLLLASCTGKTRDLTPTRCDVDADCAPEFRCDKAVNRPVKGMIPCPGERACTTASECNTAEVCGPNWQIAPDNVACQPLLCGEPCTADSCPADSTCGATGVCELIPCDAPNGVACAAHWRCDPEAAKNEDPYYFPGTITLEPDVPREIGHGCARIPCDEPAGYECAELYACRVDAATSRPACLPESCRDTGHCLDDEFQVCFAESKHPDFAPDEHGCVPRGCDEGYSCSTLSAHGVEVGYCDYAAPNAEPTSGCAIHVCESDTDCGDMQKCDPMGPFADGIGCRNWDCVEGLPCPSGWLCDLGMTADVTGCYEPASIPSGGASGAGGSNAGAGGSNSGAAGGTGGSVMTGTPGECVRR